MITKPMKFILNLEWKDYEVEIWKLAVQTNWSCTVKVGWTMVLATVCMNKVASNAGFFPLSVSYQEKLYASWVITSNRFNKREWRPSDDKVLSWRLIDRWLRPLFPKWFDNEIQLIITILSYDRENEHDTAAWLAASVAMSISEAPFLWPNALLRVWQINWEFILNPTVSQSALSDLDLVVTSTSENIVMIECWANIVSEERILEWMNFAFEHSKKVCEFISSIVLAVGKPKIQFIPQQIDPVIKSRLAEMYSDNLNSIIFNEWIWKLERFSSIADLKESAKEILAEELGSWVSDEEKVALNSQIATAFEDLTRSLIRTSILKNWRRIKWRALDEIRSLSCEIGLLPRCHWSWLFNRWETQALSVVTLWWPGSKQLLEWIEWESEKRYMHHYNFPPFSVGEVSKRFWVGNREIWHWALAERALIPVLPKEIEFPYVVRVVTDILSSNWSSSMAAATGSTLALMDAWVPIKAPVAWIAMWLITDKETWEYKILTDLQDEEDFGGDMDFKVAWTKDWVTAIQMDIKLTWIPMPIFKEAFAQAKKWRMQVLNEVVLCIPVSRDKLSEFAPRLMTLVVNKDDIKIVIWKWWETIQKIIAETWVKIDITDEWLVTITAESGEAWEEALRMIKSLVAKPEVWAIYEWKITKIMDFWAFMQIMKGVEWLIHVSNISSKRVENVSDVLKEWEIVKAKLIEIDKMWRYKLSIKDVDK